MTKASRRVDFIDNLRWAMTILVVSMHAADTYSPFGNWYYTDRAPLGVAATLAFGAWQMYLQAFFMGLLFFVAGVFTPGSIERKGAWRFVKDRAFRLGLPVLLYMFVLGPVVEYFLAHSWNSTKPTSFAHEWVKHIRNGQVWQENGPLWFCLALLIFSCVYAAMWRRGRASEARVPGNFALTGFALAMASATFLVRLALPLGYSLLNMHLGDFPQYLLLFAAGIAAARGRWLERLPFATGVRWMAVALPAGFAAWLGILLASGAASGNVRGISGGWHWQSAAMNLWEAFTCVAVSYGVIVIFREWVNRPARFLADNAFSVYMFHPVFVILGARMLRGVEWPGLAKFAALWAMAATASFAASEWGFRRVAGLKRIL